MKCSIGRLTGGFLLGIIFVLFPLNLSFAQIDDFATTPTPTPVDYKLPYPGLLPDHPFYFLKHARDAIAGFFTSNALKKAEYNLQQSNKQVEASRMLIDKRKNVDLAVTTFDEAILSFEEAIAKAIAAKQQGMNITEIVKQFSYANRKHQEVARNLAKGNPEKFEKKVKKLEELGKKVKTLQPKE